MNILYQLIKGFRLSVSIPAASLVHIGYKLSGQNTDWFLVTILLIITGLVMLQNDYFDRDNDRKKGKNFAYENRNFLQIFLLISWSLVIIAIFCLFTNQRVWLVFTIGIGIGIVYSFLRKKVLLPTITVALLSASPLFLASGLDSSLKINLFALTVFTVIFGRETLKDIEDKDIDKGYKNTLLTSGIFSERSAVIFAGVCISIGGILSLSIKSHLHGISYDLYILGLSSLVTSVFFLLEFSKVKIGKNFFDGGMFLILIALSI